MGLALVLCCNIALAKFRPRIRSGRSLRPISSERFLDDHRKILRRQMGNRTFLIATSRKSNRQKGELVSNFCLASLFLELFGQ